MWAEHGHWFPWIFFGVLFAFLVVRLVFLRRYGGWCRGERPSRYEAESILQRRLASGEIDEAEYERVREILKR